MSTQAEKNIEIWKMKKLVRNLQDARGNGTSMISLIIPPRSQIPQYTKMLTDEYGTASNIKSRVNRLSVLSAITSTQQRLKQYTRCPTNGLVIFCGEALNNEGKPRKLVIDFEPFKPINSTLYMCDSKFHVEDLGELLESDDRFGFIVMDGNGSLFGALSGNTREVLYRFTVDLPKKHGRGGQSAMRFARLRDEARHNYVRKVAELAVQHFITNDKCNVTGLVLAGSADFKSELSSSDLFDPRLKAKVVQIVDVSYGGQNGFNQAIELSAESLSNVKFVQEKKLLAKYFEEIAKDQGMFCFGYDDTLKALDASAVETLLVWENLDLIRYTLRDAENNESIAFAMPDAPKEDYLINKEGQELEVIDEQAFVEWLAEHYQEYGANLEFVTDKSAEGAQFVQGFGGVGGLLRYRLNFEQLVDESDDEYFSD